MIAEKKGRTATKKAANAATATKAAPATAADAAKTPPRRKTDGDAVALLKADHREVEKLFAQYQKTQSDDDKRALTQRICTALSIHAHLEDELFYPACREKGVDTALMDEAQVEHDGAAVLIEELMAGEPGAPFHDAKVKVLSEYIQMHVREEEKPSSGIFAKAKSAGLDMFELGRRIRSLKEELETEARTRGIHPPTPRTLETQDDNGERNMARFNQERDEQGRFVSDDDRRSSGRDRDDDRRYGRSGDDDRGRSSMRDDRDDDRGRYSRSRSDDDRSGRSRDDEGRFTRGGRDDDRGGGSYGRRDDRDDRDDDRSRSSGRGRDDDRGHGGWFGDSEGHSRAAQRGWESRRDDDDDDRGRSGSSRARSDDDRGRSGSRGRDDDRGHGGWFGDSEGHSRAAQRGWDTRRDDDDDRGGRGRSSSSGSGSGRSRYDDDRGGSSSRSGRDDDRGHGGWFGDPEGHARAAERGWDNRRDDDRGGSRAGRGR